MVQKLAAVLTVGISLLCGAATASAFGIPGPAQSIGSAPLQSVSFFGRPYPYGYTGWGPCVRYLPVETPLALPPVPR
jgi:hypothetical protein